MEISVNIGKKYAIRLNGRAGTIVIDAVNNNGFTKEDYLTLASMVPPPGGKGSTLKGEVKMVGKPPFTCTFHGCYFVYVGEDGIEIKYEAMIRDFKPHEAFV